MIDPAWITEARKLIGLHEIKGSQHSPEILQMWRDIKRSGIKDDETPWCAAFVGAMLERAGIQSSRFEGAKSYMQWGRTLIGPVYGCVGVLVRKGGGHVGFIVGADKDGNLLVLGGNQDDQVNVRAFPFERFVAFRYPNGYPLPEGTLPVFSSDKSGSEA